MALMGSSSRVQERWPPARNRIHVKQASTIFYPFKAPRLTSHFLYSGGKGSSG
jgi:hypothetical protein